MPISFERRLAMTCPDCRSIAPLEDRGTIRFRTTDTPGLVRELDYATREELLELLSGKTDGLPLDAGPAAAEICIVPGSSADSNVFTEPSWLPVSVWQARLRHSGLIRIIHDRLFTSHMQPIMDLHSGSVYGYEMLLRPLDQMVFFHPHELFQAAQETGFHSFLDRAARISAIEASAKYLPRGLKRFVNFLPSSIYNPEYCLTHTFDAIRHNSQDPADYVFEVVETERITDIPKLQSIFHAYKNNGMKVALDDVGSGYSTLEVLAALKPDYVKIDRGLISYSDLYPDRARDMRTIVDTARAFGAVVLAEGMERPEELEVCRGAGIDLAQGYLFGKPAPTPKLL
jgi:EAL domain-containing protein (putative c-di-GMP-specific phosphodiesterase class I)